jgi:hypothetical protein
MVICLTLAGASYAVISSLAQALGRVAPTSQPHTRLPHSRLRMGPKLDSATPAISAALSGYAYAYSSAWRFS